MEAIPRANAGVASDTGHAMRTLPVTTSRTVREMASLARYVARNQPNAIIRRHLERDEGIVYAARERRCHIDGEVWHLDVGSSHPGAVIGPKGWAVRPLKRYAIWVQNVVRQFGPYPPWA